MFLGRLQYCQHLLGTWGHLLNLKYEYTFFYKHIVFLADPQYAYEKKAKFKLQYAYDMLRIFGGGGSENQENNIIQKQRIISYIISFIFP